MLSLATRPRTPRRSAPGSRLRRGPRLGALLLCAWLCGCGGAYADAISRGDKYAQTGMWDEAAAAYEAAIRLDPSETEGQIKLQQARQRQAAERLQRATALESRGELAAALELVQQAARFDPASTPAQQALTRMSEAALDEAEKLLSGGQPAKAFSLTALVLKGAPRHTRAKRLDAQARSVLAEQAFGRAQAYLEGGKQGNALVELAACMTYRPDFPDARLHFGKVKLALQRELRFRVVLSPFPGKGEAGPLAQGLKPALLGQALDERLLLEVVAERPKEPSPGVALAGSFSDYELAHTQRKDMHSCDYVCGTDSKPNPERARIEQEVGRAEEELGRREQEAARSEQEVLRYQQEVDRTGGSVDGKAAEVERARSELDRCRAQAKPGDTSACSSQESSLRSAQSSLESERNRLSGPRSSLDSARSRLEMARQARESARQDREQKTRQLHDTPVMITVDRYCPFEYSIETHRVLAQTKLVLTMERLGEDKPIVRDQPFQYAADHSDETRPGHPGRCPQVAAPDPLELPSEKELRQELLTKVVGDLRSKVLAGYDAYRQRFLAEARRSEAAGLNEEAVESYVRYVLTGTHDLKEQGQIRAFLSKAKGLGQFEALWSQ